MPKQQILRWKNNGHVGKLETKQILRTESMRWQYLLHNVGT